MSSAATTKGCQPSVKGSRRRLCRAACEKKVPGENSASAHLPVRAPASDSHRIAQALSGLARRKLVSLGQGDTRDKVDVDRMPMTVDNPEGIEGAAPEGPSLGWLYVHSTSTESIHPESSTSLRIAH